MRVRARGGLDAPVGGFLELAEAHQRHRARAEHAEQQRVERAQSWREWSEDAMAARGSPACEWTKASV